MTVLPFPSDANKTLLKYLRQIFDPELGLNIVDLGLVYAARHIKSGICVDLTLTSRACPMSETLIGEIEGTLHKAFPNSSFVDVHLVWEPRWDPDFITARGQAILGHI